ncbi:MAG: MmcQ/YjbR family DNA-binding protein [Chloroflexi bacterium]|nr:MAG: MmcQ/YjbR family DNA-binding protein [Chloroflexota bacterium]
MDASAVKYAEFRRLCLSQPEAEHVETWGEDTFRVRGKIFAMGSAEGRAVSLKASLDDQAGLVGEAGEERLGAHRPQAPGVR